MLQTRLTNNDKIPFLKTDYGHYNLYNNYSVKAAQNSPFNSKLRPELNFYIHATSSHSLQGFGLRPCAGSHKISKNTIINNNVRNNNHSNIERTSDTQVKSKVVTGTQQITVSESKKELKPQSGRKRWKLGKPCNIWPECADTSGLAFVIKKHNPQKCPGISKQEKQQNTVQKSVNTTCFTLKHTKDAQNTSKRIFEKCRFDTPKSINTNCKRMKDDSCAKVSKKVTFDLTNIKSNSNENFIPKKPNLQRCKHSVRALNCNFTTTNKAIFSELGQPRQRPAGKLRNQNKSWDLKVNYGCSDFRERLMLEMQRNETRKKLGFPLQDSNDNYKMYPFISSYQAY